MSGFLEGGNERAPNNESSQQQTQPTYDTNSRILTWDTLGRTQALSPLHHPYSHKIIIIMFDIYLMIWLCKRLRGF